MKGLLNNSFNDQYTPSCNSSEFLKEDNKMLITPEEFVIVCIVLFIWVWSCVLFYIRCVHKRMRLFDQQLII